MKFTKTAVAVAIAGIAAAPMIASADTTLSGVVQIKIQGSDAEDIDEVVDDPLTLEVNEAVRGSRPGEAAIAAGDARFQIVSEHELDSGLTGYGSLQVNLDALSGGVVGTPDDTDGNVQIGLSDNVYVGVKGGFGDLRFGEIPVVAEYGQVANDLHDVTGAINGGMSYTGTFGPVGLGLSFSPEANEDQVGVGAKFTAGGFAIGVGGEDRGGQTNASVGASFGYAGASIGVHYWVQQPDGDGDDPNAIAVQVGYGFGGVAASLTFSQAENVADFESKMRLDLSYGLGGGTELSTRININSDNPAVDNPATAADETVDDLTDWRIQLSKSF